MDNRTIRELGGDRWFTITNYIILSLFLLSVLYPLLYVLSASFSSSHAIVSGKVWIYPVDFTLDGYKAVFNHRLIWSGFRNSLFYMAVGTAINVALTVLAAYPLSRKDLYGRNAVMFLFVFTTMFSGGLIPFYLLVRNMGMLDTVWAMLLPGALGVWNMVITRTYFQTSLPDELLEAAQLDGCSDFSFVARVAIPLSMPVLAVITLFYAVGHWNQYFNAFIFLKSENLYPLQIVLREILIQNNVNVGMLATVVDVQSAAEREGLSNLLKYSLIVVATLPLMIIYPFVQKHFVKGVMIGSLKG
ncbi:sugar ABC transporter permease [Paenibacillus agaridevorans]|uniref:Sugar ABC transporter permease n=1 Tax=Paenibacillus agaridevorans TaxID=171404 RepID=A0A2R5EUF5_9BACL|nr:carbohydrate ABC transporter permease [Paenibacillus agaridevorans]GBG10177.1 sugar ABC transporter permease [Paenibacillus agaridevorans]